MAVRMTRRAVVLGASRLTAGALAAATALRRSQPAAAKAPVRIESGRRVDEQPGSSRAYYNVSAQLISTSTAAALNGLTAWSASFWAIVYPGQFRAWHSTDTTAVDADVSAVAFTAQAGQAPSIVQSVTYNQSSPTTSFTISITPTAGNDLILCGGTNGGIIAGVSDDRNGAWTEICRADATNGSQIFQVHDVSGQATTITVSFGCNSLTGQGAVSEASGLTGAWYFGALNPASGISRGISYRNQSGYIRSGYWFPSQFIAAQQQNDLMVAIIATSSATATLGLANVSSDTFAQLFWHDIFGSTQANGMTVWASWVLMDMGRGLGGTVISKPAATPGNSYWELGAWGWKNIQVDHPPPPTFVAPALWFVAERDTVDIHYAAQAGAWACGKWTHFAVTCSDVTSNNPTMAMYVNGVSVPVVTVSVAAGNPYSDSTRIDLGSYFGTDQYVSEADTQGTGTMFAGALADVCVWNRVISAGEAIMAMSGQPSPIGLVARWLLPGNASPELDSSGNDTSLTVNGATLGVPGGVSIGQGPPVDPGQAPMTLQRGRVVRFRRSISRLMSRAGDQ